MSTSSALASRGRSRWMSWASLSVSIRRPRFQLLVEQPGAVSQRDAVPLQAGEELDPAAPDEGHGAEVQGEGLPRVQEGLANACELADPGADDLALEVHARARVAIRPYGDAQHAPMRGKRHAGQNKPFRGAVPRDVVAGPDRRSSATRVRSGDECPGDPSGCAGCWDGAPGWLRLLSVPAPPSWPSPGRGRYGPAPPPRAWRAREAAAWP